MGNHIDVDELIDRYDGFLIDAYGVLVTSAEAMPGAATFLDRLADRGLPYDILTNDASRLPETAAQKYRSLGLPIDDERVLTSGGVIAPVFEQRQLTGARTCVLGPADSKRYAERAGAELVAPDEPFDVLIVADEAGFEFRSTLNDVVSHLLQRFRPGAQDPPALLCPNPDFVYQRSSQGDVGITSGSIAAMIEAILDDQLEASPMFDRLGKPHPAMYRTALERMDADDPVMLGDQLQTDIAGARRVGIDAVLVGTGLTSIDELPDADHAPTWLMRSLE
jgi:HAD superfamily hydrolase (TIGR01450 family)